MNDSELQKVILQKYYENREEDWIPVNPKRFGEDIPIPTILRISGLLQQRGLIEFKGQEDRGTLVNGW